MTDVLSTPSQATPPPRRPHKSRLRILSATDQMSTHSSTQSIDSLLAPSEAFYDIQGDDTASIDLAKLRYQSRFTEHFDKQQQKRPEIPTASKSLNAITSLPSLLKVHKLDRSLSFSSNDMMSNNNSRRLPDEKQINQSASLVSTPLQLPQYGSDGSVLSTQPSTTIHHPALNNASLNRADFIIARLETWHQCLKSVTNWVEEVAKISLQSSRGFSQKAYPHVDQSLQDNVDESIRTIQAGFKALTMHMAAEQQAFSKCLEKDHLPALVKLRKQVKDKIHQLKNDSTLVLDELLRRAEVTRSKMTHLNRCCKQADKVNMVLRQLKREVDEENRLRLLMIPIQKDTEEFEQQVINQIKPTVKYCYEFLAPGAWNGAENTDTTALEHLMDQITPQQTWEQFVQENEANIVSEKNPTKDYLKIKYPNKFHPMVMTLLKGKMERKVGVRKQFIERNYVLSQGGYLHQFSLNDKVSPEKTIYIPSTTIVPSIDLNQLNTVLTEYTGDASNTFEICRPATNVLQRDKISVFRTSTREELVTWCRMLVQIASGVSLSSPSLGISSSVDDDDMALKSSSLSFDELDHHPSNVRMTQLDHSLNIGTTKKISIVSVASLSPARSLRSVQTEESFNEPAAYCKSLTPPPTATTFAVSTPISNVIAEEEIYYVTDAESFVTAQLVDDGDDANPYFDKEQELKENETIDIEETTNTLIDYFQPQLNYEDDSISIASTSTAKGHTAPTTNPLDVIVNERSPSLLSTSDAQSSLYFSSASGPSSPSSLSDDLSNMSIPEFQMPTQVGSNDPPLR
ncbi:hypothetical protein [Parasitella parasitica]|uniref:PH domain-containing protein n=1 Tax=Parasitella parasitica TaxID=35722 RepID=A0A0B7MNZ3_9FUNG|nr:hypothetical protein [Parasitella parasitica]